MGNKSTLDFLADLHLFFRWSAMKNLHVLFWTFVFRILVDTCCLTLSLASSSYLVRATITTKQINNRAPIVGSKIVLSSSYLDRFSKKYKSIDWKMTLIYNWWNSLSKSISNLSQPMKTLINKTSLCVGWFDFIEIKDFGSIYKLYKVY